MHTTKSLKSQAKLLRAHFSSQGIEITHSQALEAVAAAHAFKNWRTAEASVEKGDTPSKHVSPELYMRLEQLAVEQVASAEGETGASAAATGIERIPSVKTSNALEQAKRIRENQEIAAALEDENISLADLLAMFGRLAKRQETSDAEMEAARNLLERIGRRNAASFAS